MPVPDIRPSNFASGRLAAPVIATDVLLFLNAGDGAKFPTVNVATDDIALAVIEDSTGAKEIVRVTNVSGDTLTVVRGQEGTVARPFASGSRVEVRLTAGWIQNIYDRALENAVYMAIALR